MDANDTRADLHLSKRFFNATEWAAARHAASTDGELESRPSLGQVLGIAAMLLDAIGSDVARLAEVRSTFGKKTAKLVEVLTRSNPRGSLTQELRATFAETQRLVELDTATAAWRVAHVDAA